MAYKTISLPITFPLQLPSTFLPKVGIKTITCSGLTLRSKDLSNLDGNPFFPTSDDNEISETTFSTHWNKKPLKKVNGGWIHFFLQDIHTAVARQGDILKSYFKSLPIIKVILTGKVSIEVWKLWKKKGISSQSLHKWETRPTIYSRVRLLRLKDQKT